MIKAGPFDLFQQKTITKLDVKVHFSLGSEVWARLLGLNTSNS